mmetsp:Transcript_31565/g.81673  ORF Transcript_31565/g.81673 Transcript_31565/m.81673 type:complete len:85 (-) Transcript_31565:44-298(-)
MESTTLRSQRVEGEGQQLRSRSLLGADQVKPTSSTQADGQAGGQAGWGQSASMEQGREGGEKARLGAEHLHVAQHLVHGAHRGA